MARPRCARSRAVPAPRRGGPTGRPDGGRARLTPSVHRGAAGVFLAGLALGALTSRGLVHGDGAVTLARAHAWVAGRATLSLDVGDTWVAAERTAGGLVFDDGEGLRAASPPGMALCALPGAALTAPFAERSLTEVLSPLFTPRASPRATLAPLQRDPRVIAFALLGPLFAGLAAACLWRAARARGLPPAARRLALAAFLVGSPTLCYAGTPWTQLPVTAAAAFALWQLCEPAAPRRAWAVGTALGLACLVRLDAALLAPPSLLTLGLAAGAARSPRAAAGAVARALAPIGLGLGAAALLAWPADGGGWSLAELPRGLPGLLVGPRAGLLVYAPFVVLAPWGLRADPLRWTLAGAPVALWVFYAGWFDWSASLAYGPRFLLPALPALALALGHAPARARAVAWGLVAWGAAVALPGALVAHPRLPDGRGPLWATVREAWGVLVAGDSVGSWGVDVAATYVPAYAVVGGAAAFGAVAIGVAERARRAARSPLGAGR